MHQPLKSIKNNPDSKTADCCYTQYKNHISVLGNNTLVWCLKFCFLSISLICISGFLYLIRPLITTTLAEKFIRILILFSILSSILCLLIVSSVLALILDEIYELKNYSWVNFGYYDTINERTFDTSISCNICGDKTQAGVKLEYYTERVILGFSIKIVDYSEFILCSGCYQ